jgi:hyperosmotically inducible periplasmic protein
MKRRMLERTLMAAVLVLGSAVAWADAGPGTAQTDIEKRIGHEIRMYPYYSIWDDVSFRVQDGSVELLGAVNQPWKKADVERLVAKVPGVASVTNEIKVLPLSAMDDQLRLQVARAVYGYPLFDRYAVEALPPIHIIVENGRVTLDGVVASDMEKQIAGMRASSAGLSFGVTNNLQVEHPSKKS